MIDIEDARRPRRGSSRATGYKGRGKPLDVLIIPDKFKGTLSAGGAAEAIARGWRKVRPGDHLQTIPMSDGGDGFGEVLGGLSQAERRTARVPDAAGRKRTVPWWWVPDKEMAIVESARAIGLAMLPPGKFHPFELDTTGLGCLLEIVAACGATRFVVGIGGSATNDGGFGMAKALGWKFIDRQGEPLEQWTQLDVLQSIRPPKHRRPFRQLVVAVDVKNPLLGAQGATRIYGPQKGLRSGDLAVAERCLRRLALVVRDDLGEDSARLPGAGAAGGLGFALHAFLGARFQEGFEIFARQAKLQNHIKLADLVITGEGAIDASTLMGKGVGQVAKLCRSSGTPCIGLAGAINTGGKEKRLFQWTSALTELTSLQQAKANAGLWLERLSGHAAEAYELRVG